MTRAAEAYGRRMARVLDHVDAHLDDPLDLDTLSAVAAFSRFHFHRQFSATFGLPVGRYVQLARMKRAADRLAFVPATGVTDVALEAGYDAPDAFARAFRRLFGQAPSAFRAAPDWVPLERAFRPFRQARSKLMTDHSCDDVTIREVAPIPVAVMTHRGDPATIAATVRRFIEWRRAAGLPPALSDTFGVFPTDTRITAPEDFRMELCATVDRPVATDDPDVVPGLIPGGRVAVLRLLGTAGDDLEPAALFLYRDWLPHSGEEPGDFPLYCQRLAFFPLVPAHEAVTDLFLPLR